MTGPAYRPTHCGTGSSLLATLLFIACGSPSSEPGAATSSRLSVVGSLTGTPTAGFTRALEQRDLAFPRDHGPHPDFLTEWWYFTGNLLATEGRRFGFQLTFFRSALAPPAEGDALEASSAWRAAHLYMGHFALTDIESGEMLSFERFSRGAMGLAGATAEPFRVWLDDWEVAGLEPLQLRAEEEDVGLSLALTPTKPIVFHGDRGLSRKGSEPGNASYYYSLTRLASAGRVRLGDETYQVSGSSWMDREWSTSLLEEDQVGWDWFSIQLDDGRDLMLFQLRRLDGTPHALSSGTLVAADGSARPLGVADFVIETLAFWTSPATGATYPAGWRVRVGGAALDLELRPLVADQEIRHTFLYWEGAVEVSASASHEAAGGRGYVELTGYGDAPAK